MKKILIKTVESILWFRYKKRYKKAFKNVRPASGKELDRIAELYGIKRTESVSNDKLREVLLESMNKRKVKYDT